jgi:3-phosphoglycerate kinase
MYFRLTDFDFSGKRVLVRVDYNVPVKKGKVTDVTRIEASLPTLKYLLKKGAALVLISHLGRPSGKEEKYSLRPVAKEVEKLLGVSVTFVEDCVGDVVQHVVSEMGSGDVVLLENLRFYAEEKANDSGFAGKLASYADYYVNDAFGAAHRAHASVDAVTQFLPSASGYLLEKEMEGLFRVMRPEKPFVCILGGVKISGKIETIHALVDKADKLLIGGAMASAFLKAKGLEIGKSKVDAVDVAEDILKQYHSKIVLPVDVVVAQRFEEGADHTVVDVDAVSDDEMILDIGPRTASLFCDEMQNARTVFWNGPLGAAELESFAGGTKRIADCLSSMAMTRVIGGGDTEEVVVHMGLRDTFTHVSTGGGAALEFIGERKLAAVAALERSWEKFKQKVLSQ